MNIILEKQYDLIKSARQALLNFLEANLKEQVFTQVPVFNDKTIAYMLVHVVNTYISWAGNFTLKMERSFYDDQNLTSLDQIKSLFEEADLIMQRFISTYGDLTDQKFTGYKPGNRFVEATIIELFTHVTTHEFHHKGQIMTMCRLLGHVPCDTDIIRF